MDLKREDIERSDFPAARRGYDSKEVDRHLRAIAEAVEQLRSTQRPAPPSVSGAAAERVQSIVEAAERSAREIEQQAQQDAQRVAQEADAQAAEQLGQAQAAAEKLIARAAEIHQQADQIVTDLQAMREELGTLRERPAMAPPEPTMQHEAAQIAEIPEEPADEPGPPDAEPEVVEAAAEPRAGAAPSSEGVRVIALNMALSGTPREETARYLQENFDIADQDSLLDDVYAKAGG